ncbi:MAG: hypothetical protein BJ554DRAFT_7275, partial [Olpidium bornovanus]
GAIYTEAARWRAAVCLPPARYFAWAPRGRAALAGLCAATLVGPARGLRAARTPGEIIPDGGFLVPFRITRYPRRNDDGALSAAHHIEAPTVRSVVSDTEHVKSIESGIEHVRNVESVIKHIRNIKTGDRSNPTRPRLSAPRPASRAGTPDGGDGGRLPAKENEKTLAGRAPPPPPAQEVPARPAPLAPPKHHSRHPSDPQYPPPPPPPERDRRPQEQPRDDSERHQQQHPATPSARFALITAEEAARELATDPAQGLKLGQVVAKRAAFGLNELRDDSDSESLLQKFLEQFTGNPLILLLLGSASISVMMGQWDDAFSITLYRSEQSLQALNRLVPHHCHVVRGGKSVTVEAAELVPGDLVHFSEVENRKTPLQTSMNVLGKQLSILSMAIISLIVVVGAYAADSERLCIRSYVEPPGTLTLNRMTVTHLFTVADDMLFDLEKGRQPADISSHQALGMLLTIDLFTETALGALCNNAYWDEHDKILGHPTDVALLEVAHKLGGEDTRSKMLNRHFAWWQDFERIQEMPFNSDNKYMSTTCRHPPGRVPHIGPPAYQGGVPVSGGRLAASFAVHQDGEVTEQQSRQRPPSRAGTPSQERSATINSSSITQYLQKSTALSAPVVSQPQSAATTTVFLKGALEVVMERCSTYLTSARTAVPFDAATQESVAQRAESLASGGLRIVAAAFGKEDSAGAKGDMCFVGFFAMYDPPRRGIDRTITELLGGGLDSLSEWQLQEAIKSVTVFARTTPKHKMIIVRAFQAAGEVVAMTGDGVNDAPALKLADIGISMGRSGTDVAKEAADMILVNDDFSMVLNAIEEGKSLGVEPVDHDVMRRPPRPKSVPMLTRRVVKRGGGGGYTTPVLIQPQTFTTFVLFDMFNALSCRSESKSIFLLGVFSNRMFNAAVAFSLLGQLLVIYVPFFQRVFQTAPLTAGELLRLVAISSSVFWVDEARKWYNRSGAKAANGG